MRACLVVAIVLAVPVAAFADRVTLVEGRVVGPDGAAIHGATVAGTLEFARSSSSFRVTADADGGFAVEVTPTPESPVRAVRMIAYASGLSNANEIKTPILGAPGYKPVVLALRPPVDVTVTVVDPTGLVVPSASITLAGDGFWKYPLAGVPQHVDAHGEVELHELNDRDTIHLAVAAPGYLGYDSSPDVTHPITLTIARGGTLQVRLRDFATGAPVANCDVVSQRGTTTTDAAGRASFLAPYGDFQLYPSCASYSTDWDLPDGSLEVDHTAATARTVHDVRARKTEIVHGRVEDRLGKPVAGVQVMRVLSPKDRTRFLKQGPPSERAVTNDRGEFVFASSSMDAFDISVDARHPISRHVRFADLSGPLVLVLP